jgi:hypothetical protein
MTPVTIILPLRPDAVEACRDYLKANADPRPDFADRRLQCQPLFPFDELTCLHFFSFVILPAQPGFGPQLVLDATIDGDRGDFLRGLLRVAAEGMHDVLQHCEGYPASGRMTPELALEYLAARDMGADTYFSGAPGRSAAQIQDESRLQRDCVNYLRARWQTSAGAPGRLPAIFAQMRRDVVCDRRDSRWAAAAAVMPREMGTRHLFVGVLVVLAAAVACGVGALMVRVVPSLDPWNLYGWLISVTESVGKAVLAVLDGRHADAGSRGLAAVLAPYQFSHLFGLMVLWSAVRVIELVIDASIETPRDQHFFKNIFLQIFWILRHVVVLILGGFVVSGALTQVETGAGLRSWRAVLAGVGIVLVVCAAIFALRHAAGSLRLQAELKALPPVRERVRRLSLDVVNFLQFLFVVWGLAFLLRQAPFQVPEQVVGAVRLLLSWGYVALALGTVGVLTLYLAWIAFMLVVRGRELIDQRGFADAHGLIARADINAPKYAREEGGSNTYQNHLASLVMVKGGWLRRALLRASLWGVNLLARYWFNQGELGGIPTIISARWVVIDEGRRLLFLDNFGGAWESYLNEFIDLPGYKGLNAIWSNTFVAVAGRAVGFPPTEFWFWGGSQHEQPFKAYVRESQVETLVWYGAYPTLSTVNINANTALRQAMSRDLAAHEVDAVMQRL